MIDFTKSIFHTPAEESTMTTNTPDGITFISNSGFPNLDDHVPNLTTSGSIDSQTEANLRDRSPAYESNFEVLKNHTRLISLFV